MSFSHAAAIWLRALLWTQIKRTFFFSMEMLAREIDQSNSLVRARIDNRRPQAKRLP
jgi:hypothetical protein